VQVQVAQAAISTCVEQTRADGYARRRPEDTLLHALVSEHWPRFRERAEAQGGLPKFVEEEFDAYLRCGILEYGLVQLACRGCGHEMVVGFSCKRRAFVRRAWFAACQTSPRAGRRPPEGPDPSMGLLAPVATSLRPWL
jgi:hypothetical protein